MGSHFEVVTNDGKLIPLSLMSAIVEHSSLLRSIVDECGTNTFQLAHVSSSCLETLCTYCQYLQKADSGQDVDEPDTATSTHSQNSLQADFNLKGLPQQYAILTAAEFLDMERILDILAAEVAKTLDNKTIEEVRTLLSLDSILLPNEEAQRLQEIELQVQISPTYSVGNISSNGAPVISYPDT